MPYPTFPGWPQYQHPPTFDPPRPEQIPNYNNLAFTFISTNGSTQQIPLRDLSWSQLQALPHEHRRPSGMPLINGLLVRFGAKILPLLEEAHRERPFYFYEVSSIKAGWVAEIAATEYAQNPDAMRWLLQEQSWALPYLVWRCLDTSGIDPQPRQSLYAGLRWLALRDQGARLAGLLGGFVELWEDLTSPNLPEYKPIKPPKSWGELYVPIQTNGQSLPNASREDFWGQVQAASQVGAALPDAKRFSAGEVERAVLSIGKAWAAGGYSTSFFWIARAETWFLKGTALGKVAARARLGALSSSLNERRVASHVVWGLAQRAIWGAKEDAEYSAELLFELELLTKSEKLQQEAGRALTGVALSGVAGKSLERVLAEYGAEEELARVYDFGPRQFRLSLGRDQKVWVLDEDNKPLDTLPRPRKSDDAEKAKAAIEALKEDKVEIAERLTVLRKRLELEMVMGKDWSAEEFTTRLKGPLFLMLAQRLVWEQAGRRVRVAEDGSLADEQDHPVPLGEGRIGVLHPLGGRIEPWSAIFNDYGLIQPFSQLSRETFSAIPDVSAWSISIGAVFGLLRMGWKPVYHSGAVDQLCRSIGHTTAEVHFSSYIELSGDDPGMRVQLSALLIKSRPAAPSPVAQSELIREVFIAARPGA